MFQYLLSFISNEKAFILLTIEKIFKLFSNLIIIGLIARELGPNVFGVYGLATSYFVIGQTIALAGIDGLFVREYVRANSQSRLTWYALKLRGQYSIFGIFVSITLVVLVTPNDVLSQHWISLCIIQFAVALVVFEVGDLINQANQNSHKSAQIRLIASIISSILRVLATLFNPTLIILSIIFVIEYVLIAYLYYSKIIKIQLEKASDFRGNEHKDKFWIKSDQIYFLLAALLTIIYNRLDQIIINSTIGVQANGIYIPAVSVVYATYIIASSLSIAKFPQICLLAQGNLLASLNYLKSLAYQSFIVGVIVALILVEIAPHFIQNIYGEKYYESIAIVNIMAFGIPFVFYGVISGSIFVLINKPNLNIIKNLIGLLLSISILPYLTQKYGLIGAAYSYLIIAVTTDYVYFKVIEKYIINLNK